MVDSIIQGTNYKDPEKGVMRIGVDVLPSIPKDTTDRNRTSPLAFTGNKFEFRMLGSSQSVSGPNIALNTIMAEELAQFADELEAAEDFDAALQELVCRTFTQHKRIIFDGNGYSEEWEKEAARRGLSNLPSTAECMPHYVSQKNIDLVTKHHIFTENEFRARYEIHIEAYNKILNIEALTSIDMIRRQIIPATLKYTEHLANGILAKDRVGVSHHAETQLIRRLSEAADALYDLCEKLDNDLRSVPADTAEAAQYYHNVIVPGMDAARQEADLLESLTDRSFWPYPTYEDLLFY